MSFARGSRTAVTLLAKVRIRPNLLMRSDELDGVLGRVYPWSPWAGAGHGSRRTGATSSCETLRRAMPSASTDMASTRMFTIATVLGGNQRQLGGFVWSEAAAITIAGLVTGGVGAWLLARMLVKVLNGVFDPPPATLSVSPGRTSRRCSPARDHGAGRGSYDWGGGVAEEDFGAGVAVVVVGVLGVVEQGPLVAGEVRVGDANAAEHGEGVDVAGRWGRDAGHADQREGHAERRQPPHHSNLPAVGPAHGPRTAGSASDSPPDATFRLGRSGSHSLHVVSWRRGRPGAGEEREFSDQMFRRGVLCAAAGGVLAVVAGCGGGTSALDAGSGEGASPTTILPPPATISSEAVRARVVWLLRAAGQPASLVMVDCVAGSCGAVSLG